MKPLPHDEGEQLDVGGLIDALLGIGFVEDQSLAIPGMTILRGESPLFEDESPQPASEASVFHKVKHAKVSRVVDDLESFGLSRDEGYQVLLRRGVFSALAQRRDVFHLREDLKEVVKVVQDEKHRLRVERAGRVGVLSAIQELVGDGKVFGTAALLEADREVKLQRRKLRYIHDRHQYLKGYLRAIEDTRTVLRIIAETDRTQVQDNDSRAQQWLEKQG